MEVEIHVIPSVFSTLQMSSERERSVESPTSTRYMTVFKIWEMLFLQAIVNLDLIIILRIYIVEFFSMMGVYMIASVMF
jgi:hypothetical protein